MFVWCPCSEKLSPCLVRGEGKDKQALMETRICHSSTYDKYLHPIGPVNRTLFHQPLPGELNPQLEEAVESVLHQCAKHGHINFIVWLTMTRKRSPKVTPN